MIKVAVFLGFVLILSGIFLCALGKPSPEGDRPWPYGFPDRIDPGARYLIYLHGKIIEELGLRPTSPEYGVYEYERILETLRSYGLGVISEPRPKDTDPKAYAEKVAGEVRTLVAAGVPPENVTVVGASKGAVIAMLASTALKNKKVNFVIMAACSDPIFESFDIDLYGNVLSIYDFKDKYGRTCDRFFAKASGLGRKAEIELKLGTGHAVLFQPLKEWVEPTVRWAKGEPVG
jgi:hypothetical protein